ncbi:MAG: PQQ-dependent sugar dehydrogenase [Fibrobacteria bacterium]
MNRTKLFFIPALLLQVLALNQAFGWTYSSPTAKGKCSNLDESGSANDFTITSIVSRSLFPSPGVSDPIKMTFVMPSDTSTHPDIIFVERFGKVKYYSAAAKTLTLIGTVTGVSNANEDGLIGVAVEKPFKDRLYVVFSHSVSAGAKNSVISGSYRLSRFSLNASTHMMDMGSEKILLDVPSARGRWHTSGGLEFDNDGNLYWSVGDNETAFTGPANTHDLRGSLIRIHPNDNGVGYTIPPGNFAEVWGNKFDAQGRAALAAKYRDTSRVRPEIYIKGTRNNYSFSVDPYRKQVAYSQCGPDYGGKSELHSNTLTPVFAGWPFWSGLTTVQSSLVAQYNKNGASEPTGGTWQTYLPANKEKPVNTWTATMAGAPGPGVDTLPPYSPPKSPYDRSCAIGSVIVHYDGRVANPGKLPPQMDNVWLMGDYDVRMLRAGKVDSNGNLLGTLSATPGIFTTGKGTANGIGALLDLQQGPDGAVYVLNNNCSGGSSSGEDTHYSDACTGIVRIEYKGEACSDTALHPGGGFVTGIGMSGRIERGPVDWVHVSPDRVSVLAEGRHSVRISDVRGKVLATMQGEGRKEYRYPEGLASNAIYFLEARTVRGINVRGFYHR